jgi:hypothetical protein
MLPSSESGCAGKMIRGWGPVVFYKGNHYPGRIIACSEPLSPGDEGEATIGIIEPEACRLDLALGEIIELRDGPSIKVAEAEVVAIVNTSDTM